MKETLFALSFGFALLILATRAAEAAPQCAPRETVLEQLSQTYGESRRGMGIAANNTVMEVFAAEGGSWTVIVTLPDGMTCLVASGQGYETLSGERPARGEPA